MQIFPFSRFTVYGNSMTPALSPGQDVVSFNWAYLGKKPKVGDIVIINVNGKKMVKRVQKIVDRKVFVKGDNKLGSTDSGDFGPINIGEVIGKVVYQSNTHQIYRF